MPQIFIEILNMSISASYLILAILVLRPFLKKAPKWMTVALWGVAAVRLVCPFSVKSIFSLIPSARIIDPHIMIDPTPSVNTGIPIVNEAVNPIILSTMSPNAGDSANPLQILIPLAAVLWLVGVAVMLVYALISYAVIKRRVAEAVLQQDNVYLCDRIGSPFVLGLVRPRIYLPFNIDPDATAHVIAHEQAHIQRRDHLWKPLGFVILALHWFNPLAWLAYVLLCRDIELACDEKVIVQLEHDARADYSEALLSCSVSRRSISACPLAFGEVGVKKRIRSVLSYKKPAFWIIIAAVVACVAVAVCFLTNPYSNRNYICRRVDDAFLEEAVNSTLDESFIDDKERDELLNNLVLKEFKSFKEPITFEILSTEYLLYKNKDTISYTVKAIDADGFTNVLKAYIQPRGSKAPLGKALIDESKINNLIYGFVPPASGSDKLSYIVSIQDFGCDVKDATINFDKARSEDGKLIFDIHWANENSDNIDIGPDFELYKSNGSTLEKLDHKGVWLDYREILAGKGITVEGGTDGLAIENERIASYNLSEHYDVLTPGKYRFEAHGAWVEFQIITDFSDFSFIYDTASFDVDGDGKEENCSLRCGTTSGLFTFVFLVQDKETGVVESETTIYSQVYELSFQKGSDGITRVQGITQGENPETHLFDISIKDGYVYLTENGVYIGEIN